MWSIERTQELSLTTTPWIRSLSTTARRSFPVAALAAPALLLACSSESTIASGAPPAGGGGTAGSSSEGPSGAGGASPAPSAALPTCDPGARCGGDPRGTWSYSGACLAFDLEAELRSTCPGAVVEETTADVTGRVVIGDSAWLAFGAWNSSLTTSLPASCALDLGGGCAGVASALRLGGADTASCSAAAGGGCRCALTYAGVDELRGAWEQIDETSIDVEGTRYGYCVDGDGATFVPVTGSAEAPLGYVTAREADGCQLPVPNAAIPVREETSGSVLRQTYEVCAGATLFVGGGETTVYARTGSTVRVNAGGATIYAEPGVELSINGAGHTFVGDLEDYGSPSARPELVSGCEVRLQGGSCAAE